HPPAGDVAAPGRLGPGRRGRARAGARPGQRRFPPARQPDPGPGLIVGRLSPFSGTDQVETSWASGLFAGAPWAPTRALGPAVVLVGVCVLIAVTLGRLDLVVLACPFALGTAWSLRNRPGGAPSVSVGIVEESAAEGDQVNVVMAVRNPNTTRVDVAVARLNYSRWLDVRHGDRPYATD